MGEKHKEPCGRFQGKPFNITVIQVYAPTSNTEEAEVEWFYEDLQDLLELIKATGHKIDWIKHGNKTKATHQPYWGLREGLPNTGSTSV